MPSDNTIGSSNNIQANILSTNTTEAAFRQIMDVPIEDKPGLSRKWNGTPASVIHSTTYNNKISINIIK